MRVISGISGGRKLKSPGSFDIRPTSDMVKESIFNIVQFDIEGRRVLDLFAGTGQLGIEALSRGAGKVVFVDTSRDAVKLIRENIDICRFTDKDSYMIYRRDALSFLRNCEPFDLIFLDPPYGSGLASKTIAKIIEFDKLKTNGIIICELRTEDVTPAVILPYFMHKEYTYGSVKIARYGRE